MYGEEVLGLGQGCWEGLSDGWAVAGGEERVQDEAQVPVTGDRVGGGAVPEIGGGVGFIYSFFMHSFT